MHLSKWYTIIWRGTVTSNNNNKTINISIIKMAQKEKIQTSFSNISNRK